MAVALGRHGDEVLLLGVAEVVRCEVCVRSADTNGRAPEAEFVAVAHADDLRDGGMDSYDVGATEIILVRLGEQFFAYDGICPHQSARLAEGELDGTTLTCDAHGWCFDIRSGQGINPRGASLVQYPVRVTDNIVKVCTAGNPTAH